MDSNFVYAVKKKSILHNTLEIGILDIKITYENISRYKTLYNKILVSKFAERIRICCLKKEGFSLLPMDVYRTQKVQHARSHGKEGVLSRSLLHIFSFSLFFSVSLVSRSLRPPVWDWFPSGFLTNFIEFFVICQRVHRAQPWTRFRARHSYAKQINSLKETNLYLPFFLPLSLSLSPPPPVSFPRERRAAAREPSPTSIPMSLLKTKKMIPWAI